MSQNQNTNRNIIVTGAAGYIGGTICIELKKRGYKVYAIDRRDIEHLRRYYDESLCNDFTDYEAMRMYKRANPAAIIHCAGTSLVGPSMKAPGIYFHNNVARTNTLLNYVINECPQTKVIFSSSAAVYGNPVTRTLDENQPTNPMSPYGESKLMVEQMLKWFNVAYGLKYIAFRYFNACGADPHGKHGQEPNATHIFAKIFEAVRNDSMFTIHGSDYPTEDGTCIRDYIHVTDLAEAHIMAIENDTEGVYNLGTLKGTSNLEVYNAVCDKLDKKLPVMFDKKREGDPAILIADSTKWQHKTGWTPKYTMSDIVEHLNIWYNTGTFRNLK